MSDVLDGEKPYRTVGICMVEVDLVPYLQAIHPPRGAMPWRPCLRQLLRVCILLFDRTVIYLRRVVVLVVENLDLADWKSPLLNLHAASDDLRGGFPLICEEVNKVG